MVTAKLELPAIGQSAWAEYREVFDNKSDELCKRYVARTYKKASLRGTIRTMHIPLISYVCNTAAPAFSLPLRVTGNEQFQKLIKRWRPTLARSWQVRKSTGSAFPHVARRRGRLILDLLWGDALQVKPDPEAPTEWDLIFSATIPTTNNEKLVYRRDMEGNVTAERVSQYGETYETPLLEGWQTIPIFPMYRDDTGSLSPVCDRTLLDIHIAAAMQLSDIEFRRVFRTNQMWRSSELAEENKSRGGSDIESAADAVLELGAGDRVGLLESSLKPLEDLEYVEAYLRLAAKTLQLPPELFITASRAETGAAKSWDYRPLLEVQQKDREEADEWLAGFVAYIRPVLEAEKVVSAGEVVAAHTVASKLPLPVEVHQHAMGIREMMKLGLTSPVREISLREGVGYSQAEKILKYNLAQSKLIGITPDKEEGQ